MSGARLLRATSYVSYALRIRVSLIASEIYTSVCWLRRSPRVLYLSISLRLDLKQFMILTTWS